MLKPITSMTDAEFVSHHAAGLAQINAYGRKVEQVSRNAARIQRKIDDLDKLIATFKTA